MKRVILGSLICLLSHLIFAQISPQLHIEGDAIIDSALQVNQIELVDSTGDVRIRLNANDGALEMLDNDTLFYKMSVNSPRKTLEYNKDRTIRYITCWSGDNISQVRVLTVERKVGNSWVKIRSQSDSYQPGTNIFLFGSKEYYEGDCVSKRARQTYLSNLITFCGQTLPTVLAQFESAGICVPEVGTSILTSVTIEYDCPSGIENQITIKNKTGELTLTKATNSLLLGENSKGESFNLIKDGSSSALEGTITKGGEEKKIKIVSNGDTIKVINYLSDTKYIEHVTKNDGFGSPKKLYSVEYCLDEGKVTTTLPDSTFFTIDVCKIIKGKLNKLKKTETIGITTYKETYEDNGGAKIELEVKPALQQAVWTDLQLMDWESILGHQFGINLDSPEVILFNWKASTGEKSTFEAKPLLADVRFKQTKLFGVMAPGGGGFELDVSMPDEPSFTWESNTNEELKLQLDIPNGSSLWEGMKSAEWEYPNFATANDEYVHLHVRANDEFIKQIIDLNNSSDVAAVYNPKNHEITFTGDQPIKVTIDGDLCVSGNISAANFPPPNFQSPTTGQLTMMEYGLATTDSEGLSTIVLPHTFVDDGYTYTYQLTAIGSFVQIMVKEKIKDGKFVIQTSLPNIEVSWQITARQYSSDKAPGNIAKQAVNK
jgi:hypothetical protein